MALARSHVVAVTVGLGALPPRSLPHVAVGRGCGSWLRGSP